MSGIHINTSTNKTVKMVYSIQEGMSCIKVSTSEDIASIVPLLFEQTSDSRDVSFLDLPQASLWGEGHAR